MCAALGELSRTRSLERAAAGAGPAAAENSQAANTRKAYQFDMNSSAPGAPHSNRPGGVAGTTPHRGAVLEHAGRGAQAGRDLACGWTRSASCISWRASTCPPAMWRCGRSGRTSGASTASHRRRKCGPHQGDLGARVLPTPLRGQRRLHRLPHLVRNAGARNEPDVTSPI